ncbi:class I SAM-dependent methyltransferase [Clostridium estertheticum]|uniref:class I SAM-dependent methyltransferase n=1 Tax=Clostridium estertheticum TaxID=238834 RepID=UPI001CF17DD5|nr:class I SAM-dependent methyltransferase [Clostridium estertheticum]MCB2305728.1 class I SAM-dependent methyltransferase [Clostridium estertheticum]MCB2347095.1 class I SAM-dependent methyltransferase [Clostridium estertheticum]MCB2348083.1 class I SAM-dependent methyltransferase [Clostridium estertheticum]WAG45723.1 class I SAM-dependent methyltransferase [Clostridium estertheticum]
MSEIAKRLNQCRKPTGDIGKAIAKDMNIAHFELTNWGFEKINIKKNDVILDIGCGGGRTVNRMASIATEGKTFGIDYSTDCVKWSKDYNEKFIKDGSVEILHASVEKIPFENDKFDVISAVETIYFWPNLVENFKEVKRVLKPSGKLIIICEMYSSERFKERNDEFVAISDMEIHTPEELKLILEKAGYNNIKIDLMEDKNWLCCVCEK